MYVDVDVAVIVGVDVIAPVIVAALVSGNETVEVIDTRGQHATGGWEWVSARSPS